MTIRRVRALAGCRAAALALWCSQGVALAGGPQGDGPAVRSAAAPFVDVHAHPDPEHPSDSVQAALRAMPTENAARIFFLPPPFTLASPDRYEVDVLLPAVGGHADRIGVLGGGGTLNPMIHEAVRSGDAGPAVRRRFRERAEALLRDGVAGFGELAAEHFQGATPYQSAPPDHPLFLLLADIAAGHGVPILLHLEAVPEPMPPPADVPSPPAPRQLRPNIEALERLLAHDRRARIVWAHAGWDNTGRRTPALCRRLLSAHPNLFMDVKVDPARPGLTPPLAGGALGTLDPEWLALFQEYPDRFVIGTDQHYPEPAARLQRWEAAVHLLDQLPAEVRRKVGTENAARLFSRPEAPAR